MPALQAGWTTDFITWRRRRLKRSRPDPARQTAGAPADRYDPSNAAAKLAISERANPFRTTNGY
jgi:hypothetical protein